MTENKTLVAALDLMRRLPPSQIDTNLQFSLTLVPDLADDLLQTVDVPLKVATDKEADKDYLLCDYNRDGDSYRSPWTNKYFPELDGRLPTKKLRDMEVAANQVFNSYCQAYFDGGISSCYFWETSDQSFAACIVFKKDGSKKRDLDSGVWDSIHIVEVTETSKDKAKYRLSTTIILSLANKSNTLDLSGNVQRQHEEELKFDNKFNNHVVNIGNIIQSMENKLYDQLQTVYFDKAREITRTLRSIQSNKENQKQILLQNELFNALNNRKR